MKKFLAILISLALLAGLLLSGMSFSFAEEADEADYVRFTATGNDPYASFKFSSEGKNTTIDPDTVTWAAIRYRTISQFDNTGVPFKGQLYVSPAAEPFIPVTYNFSMQWETVIVDCTSVSESTSMSSKWDSSAYTQRTNIRFDPLESDRDAEAALSSDNAYVSDGDQIDIAWLAFFENEADARAYTGKEDTPYCIIDAASLMIGSGGNNISAERFQDGEAVATPTPKVIGTGTYPLYDTSENTSTGYWMHPFNIDDILEVTFPIDQWFVGFSFFAWCSENDVFLDIELLNDNGDVVWSGRQVCFSNALQEVSFDKSFPPGYYTIYFICAENPDYPEGANQHFVLGSGQPREDIADEIEVYGFLGSSSLGAPHITLFTGDADPDYATPEPTEEFTPEPVVTEAPTDAPTATPEVTEAPTEEPVIATEEPKASGCGNVIGGGIAVIAAAAVLMVIRKKH